MGRGGLRWGGGPQPGESLLPLGHFARSGDAFPDTAVRVLLAYSV